MNSVNQQSDPNQHPWELYVLTEKEMQTGWGPLEDKFKHNSLKGAIAFGVNNRRGFDRPWRYHLIHCLQLFSHWFGIKAKRALDELNSRVLTKHYIQGKEIPLSFHINKVDIMHSFFLGSVYTVKERKNFKQLKNKKERLLEQLQYGYNPLTWFSLRREKKRLQEEINRLRKHYLTPKKDLQKSIWIAEAGETGLRTKVWKLNEDNYSHLLVFIPPVAKAEMIYSLARHGTINEKHLFHRQKSYHEVPAYHFKQALFLSIIDRLKNPSRKIDSMARAASNLIQGDTIKDRYQQPKSMICSEFSTRILHTVSIFHQFNKMSPLKIKTEKNSLSVDSIKTLILNRFEKRRKKCFRQVSISDYAAAGLSPSLLAELLLNKCRPKMS